MRREQTGYEQQIQAVEEAMKAIQEQIDTLSSTVSQNKVWLFCHHISDIPDQLIWIYFMTKFFLLAGSQDAVRKAQEELAKQKVVIMAQDKALKVQFLFNLSS